MYSTLICKAAENNSISKAGQTASSLRLPKQRWYKIGALFLKYLHAPKSSALAAVLRDAAQILGNKQEKYIRYELPLAKDRSGSLLPS